MDFDDAEKTKLTKAPTELRRNRDSSRAYLIVLAGNSVGEMFKVEGEIRIGRSPEADITLLDEGISRFHCSLQKLPTGDVVINDLGSTNGTFANGEPIKQHFLGDGDKIQVGGTTILKFTYHDDLEESFQRQMYESALRDGLTQAFNKRYFTDRLHAEFSYADRHHTALSLSMLDIDHFKRLNDNHGHLAGDYVLQKLVQQTETTLRHEDVLTRYGGEEFAVISRGIDLGNAGTMAERVRNVIENHQFVWDGEVLPVTVSVGVAALPEPKIKSPEQLIAAADAALYEAKRGGRNRVILHKEE